MATALVLLTIVVVILIYRVVDVGASLTFAQEEIVQLREANEVLIHYHRTRCEDFNDEEEPNSFRKDGSLVVRGVEFLCEPDEVGVSRLHAQ